MQMREATSSALVPGNRNGANKNTARITSMVTLSSTRPGGSSETSQLSHDPLLPLPAGFGNRRIGRRVGEPLPAVCLHWFVDAAPPSPPQ